ncbi:MAG TPA: hypothetical protein VNU46_04425 [Gemmatimonadaceae bacterium]|nr:hypothetical protein [Gemmatimonadaceae bacterium]
MLRRLAGFIFLALAAASVVPAAEAQQVLGAGDDALTVPAGTVRLRAMGQWDWFNEQYDSSGTLHALRDRFSLDTIGVAQIPALTAAQTALRSLTGKSSLDVSLGRTVVSSSGRVQTTNFGADFGMTHWLQFGLTVPIVKTRANVILIANPNGTEGNVAPNPALTDPGSLAQDIMFENQIAQAAAGVQAYCATAGGRANPLCANGAALASNAQTLSSGLAQVYNSSLVVPTQHSDIQAIINNKTQSIVSQLNAYAAIQGSGVPAVTASGVAASGVVAAAAPVLASEMQQILADPAYGIGIDSLQTVEKTHVGDIELATKILFFDSFHGDLQAQTSPQGVNGRLALGLTYRLPTGQASSPDNLLEIPTGTHEAALGINGYFDLLMGSHFWTSFIARYTKEQGTNIDVRVPITSSQPFTPLYTATTVNRTLGNLTEIEVTPRWVLNDFMSLTMQYIYQRKAQDQYIGMSHTAGPDSLTGGVAVLVDPTTLGAGTAFTEHSIAGGVSFSNLSAFARHQTSLPIEVSYLHTQTIKASGDNIPQTFRDQIQMRVYVRLFGR